MNTQMIADYTIRYKRMTICIPMAGCGLLALMLVPAYSQYSEIAIKNNWLAGAALLGALIAAPAVIYGFYIMLMHWRDLTGYNEGKKIVILAIIVSSFHVDQLSLGMIVFPIYYLAKVHPEIKAIARMQGGGGEPES